MNQLKSERMGKPRLDILEENAISAKHPMYRLLKDGKSKEVKGCSWISNQVIPPHLSNCLRLFTWLRISKCRRILEYFVFFFFFFVVTHQKQYEGCSSTCLYSLHLDLISHFWRYIWCLVNPFIPIFHLYIPWKHRKAFSVLTFSRGLKKGHRAEID